MECSGNFTQHLANGDPIDRPTVNEPKGIPAGTWEECAIAALKLKGWLEPDTFWDNPLIAIWRAERYNGFGYQIYHPEVPSPYLWGGTSHQKPGKYVSDGKWSPTAESEQIGVIAIWTALGIKLTKEAKLMAIKSEIDDTPVGKLIIDNPGGTWIKESTTSAAMLPDTAKQHLPKDSAIPFYSAPILQAAHYAIDIKSGGQVRKMFVYNGHAHVEMFGLDANSPVDHPSVSIPVPAPKHAIAVGDKKTIQEHLIRVGLLDPEADGKWGSLSQSAWRAFTRVIGTESEDLSQTALDRLATFKSFKDLDFKPKDPNDKENILAVKCIKRIVSLGCHVAISMGSDKPAYNIFHLTGTNPDGTKNDNKINHWNDLRFVAEVSQSGLVILKLCKLATCEPGRDWIDNPMNKNGTFRIRYDKQWFAWSVGRHGSRQYPALVQTGEVEGYRDSNRDGSWSGEKLMSGSYMGINIHHGYNSATVGQMSAGCQVARSIAGHEEFMRLCRRDRRYVCNNGYRFGNISLDGSKI